MSHNTDTGGYALTEEYLNRLESKYGEWQSLERKYEDLAGRPFQRAEAWCESEERREEFGNACFKKAPQLLKVARHGIKCRAIDPDKNDRTINQLIQQRDDAEEALSQAYSAVTGRPAEWSNMFGYGQAIEEIGDVMHAAIDPETHRLCVDALMATATLARMLCDNLDIDTSSELKATNTRTGASASVTIQEILERAKTALAAAKGKEGAPDA